MRLESDLLELMLATAKGELADAEPPRFAGRGRARRRHGGQGLSGHAEKGRRDRRPRRGRGAEVFHAGTALDRAAGWSPTAAACSASPRAAATVAEAQAAAYRGGRRDRLSRRLLPPRHRLARNCAVEGRGGGSMEAGDGALAQIPDRPRRRARSPAGSAMARSAGARPSSTGSRRRARRMVATSRDVPGVGVRFEPRPAVARPRSSRATANDFQREGMGACRSTG